MKFVQKRVNVVLIAFLFSAFMAVTLVGCGSTSADSGKDQSDVAAQVSEEEIQDSEKNSQNSNDEAQNSEENSQSSDGENQNTGKNSQNPDSETQSTDENTQSSEGEAKNSGGSESGGSSSSGRDEDFEPVSVTDMTGRTITLTEPVSRVVALSAADCEILYALGAGDTLVGRGEYCDYPAEVLEVPSVGSGANTNIEQIIALEPQVLFMSTMAQTEEQVNALEDAGIHVVVSDAADIEGVYQSVRIIGALLGRDAEAEDVVQNMRDTLDDLSEQAAQLEGGTVYFEVSPLEYGLWTAGKGTFMNEAAELIGLKNIFDDLDGWAEVSEEQVIARNPDLIVTITMYFGEGPTPEEEICSRAGWQNVTAVQNNAVLCLPNNELSRPVPRLTEGVQLLFDFAYGGGAGSGGDSTSAEEAA